MISKSSDIPKPMNVDVNNSVDRVTMGARGVHSYNILAVKVAYCESRTCVKQKSYKLS